MQVYAVNYMDKEPKTILFSNMDAATSFMKYLLEKQTEGSFNVYPVYETFGGEDKPKDKPAKEK